MGFLELGKDPHSPPLPARARRPICAYSCSSHCTIRTYIRLARTVAAGTVRQTQGRLILPLQQGFCEKLGHVFWPEIR